MGDSGIGWRKSLIWLIVGILIFAGAGWAGWLLLRHLGVFGDGVRSVQRWNNETLTLSPPDPSFAHLLDPAVTEGGVPVATAPINWAMPHVAVYSVPAVKSPRWRPTVRDLTDSGQAHAIELLAKDPAKESAVWSALQASMIDPKEFSAEDKDPLQFERVLVATVTKGTDWLPGDRMQWTRVLVAPINFSFAGYTVASTDSDTVKVQSIENTNTRKLSADIGLTIPGLDGPKTDVVPSSERTVKTTSDVNAQYERLGVDITPTFLRIIRESEAGGDVVGNTLISLSVTTDPSMIRFSDPLDRQPDSSPRKIIHEAISNLLRPVRAIDPSKDDDVVLLVTGSVLEDGALGLREDKASISVSPQRPVPHCPLMARVWMLYEERHINKGREFYDESKQEVSFLRYADEPRDVEVVSADDVSPAIWSIQILPPGAPTDHKTLLLGARVDDSSPYRELVFTDFRQASAVTRWARTHPGTTISHLTLNYADQGGSLVPIRKTDNDCKPQSSATREVYQPVPKSAGAPQGTLGSPYLPGHTPTIGVARSSLPIVHQRGHGIGRFGVAMRPGAGSPRSHAMQTVTYR
jgi:hypothetical protein